MLLEFCNGNSIFIVNGRVGKDNNIGRFTCRNASVVDYCIIVHICSQNSYRHNLKYYYYYHRCHLE
jgi:hypothetical protein